MPAAATTKEIVEALFTMLRALLFVEINNTPRGASGSLLAKNRHFTSNRRAAVPSQPFRSQGVVLFFRACRHTRLLFALRNSFRAKPIDAEEITTSAETAET